MAQETAVEWLEAKLKNIDYTTIDTSNFITCKIALHTFNKLWEQAKQMEKEQISKAWDDGDYAYFHSKETGRDFDNGEEYYNKIYNK